MSTTEPGMSGQGQDGLSLATALHPCLAVGVILVSEGQKILSLTQEAEQVLGLRRDQSSQGTAEILPAPLAALAQEALATGQTIAGRVLDVPLPPQGKKGTASVVVTAVPLVRAGKAGEVVLALNALGGEGQCELHLERLDRLAKIGTLAAGMVHEIKNALVASRTFMDLLLEKNQDAELADVVRRELIRIDSIVTRLLKFTGPTLEPFKPERLHEILDHSLRLVQPQLKEKGIELRKVFEAGFDRVNGNEYELQQALVNLLLNAIEAMASNGTLTVTTASVAAPGPNNQGKAPDAPRIQVTIRDTGVGIPPENVERLFEPFFTTKSGGTGLGLAVTQRIIEGHRGAVSVQSKPGQGTAFTIALPLAPEL
jgi:two-component system sensor histidine kinase AtoS